MATKVDIWNMALGHLGVTNRVVADTDTTAEAKSCALWWDTSLDDTLRAVAWPFATKYAALAGKAAAPNAEWGFSYTYPADAVTIRKVLNASRIASDKSRVPFRRTDSLVLTSVDNATVEYTVRVTDTTKFSGDFIVALSFKLAQYIAPQVAGTDQWKLAEVMAAHFKEKVVEAAANASAEEKNEPEESTSGANPKEDIANGALALLGVDAEIQNLTTERTIEARTARQFYDKARDATLRSMHWPFATKIAALAGKAAAPNADWAFSYTYPADCVDVRKILDPLGRIPAEQSRIPFLRGTGGLLFTNQDNASVEYTVRADTPSEYPPDFVELFRVNLATLMAPRLVSKEDIKAKLETLAFLWKEGLAQAAMNAQKESRNVSPETTTAEPKENICNEALHLLGHEAEIQDLELEQTVEARAARQFYTPVVEQVLRDFDWPFARKTAALAGVAADPTDEWDYSYTYPADAIIIRRLVIDGGERVETEDNRVLFTVENVGGVAKVLTDQADAIAQYTIVPTETEWPADFTGAVAALLAAKIAPRIFGRTQVKEGIAAVGNMWALYRSLVARAAVNAANEGHSEFEPDSSLERARK